MGHANTQKLPRKISRRLIVDVMYYVTFMHCDVTQCFRHKADFLDWAEEILFLLIRINYVLACLHNEQYKICLHNEQDYDLILSNIIMLFSYKNTV